MKRQEIERKIAIATIKDLLNSGHSISVNDGEEVTLERSTDQTDILDAMFTTDEDYLIAHKDGELTSIGWVRFIYGNDGWDVVNDYTTNLEHHLATSLNLAELLEEQNT